MAFAVVQHNLAIHGNSVPGSVTIGTTPTVGNLMIAFIGCNITESSITIGSGWTLFDRVSANNTAPGARTANMTAMYRYVQAGDTTALPAFWSAGSTYWSHDVYEISGVSGTWNTDFLSSVPLPGPEGLAAIPQFPIIASGLALTSGSRYNGNANWSISGSWTLDDTANNAGNFGSAGGASRVVNNGDTIDGTWSGGGADATSFGSILVLFTTSQPSGGVYPRHVFYGSNSGTTLQTSLVMPWVPKVGSLLIAYLAWSNGTATNPTITAGWTDWVDTTLVTKSMLGLYRYVQAGDTATLPAIASSGTGPWAISIIELDGGSGTFGTDHVSDKSGVQATGSSQTTTADTTTANNQFALLGYGNYAGTALATTTGFTNYLNTDVLNGAYGSWFTAFKFFPSSGSTVQGTITPSSTIGAQSYIQSIFNQGTGSISDSVNLVGVAETMAAAGATPSSGDTPAAASMSGAAAALTPSVSVPLAAASMTGHAAGVSAGSGPGLGGVAMSGAAEPLAPQVIVNLVGAGMSCAAAGIIDQAGANLGGVSFSGAAEPVLPSVGVPLAPAIFQPDIAPFFFGQLVPFPIYRLMSDTGVAIAAAIDDTPIAVIAQLEPAGPAPRSVEILLAGVGMACMASTITPSSDVSVRLTGVAASCAAGCGHRSMRPSVVLKIWPIWRGAPMKGERH